MLKEIEVNISYCSYDCKHNNELCDSHTIVFHQFKQSNYRKVHNKYFVWNIEGVNGKPFPDIAPITAIQKMYIEKQSMLLHQVG